MEEGPPAPGLRPFGAPAPDPAGAAPLRPALKSKPFLKSENIRPKVLANLRWLRCDRAIENLKIRKEARRTSFAPRSGSSFDYKML
jgi:hypothetical protein